MALSANSETAQDVAAAILRFQDPIPESATEIAATVAELFGISTALMELNTASRELRNRSRVDLVDDDKYVLLRSLEYTFKDIQRLFAGLDRPTYRTKREAYSGVWSDIQIYFRNESRDSLLTRLECYKYFVNDLTCVVIGQQPSPEIDELYDKIDHLLEVQDEGLGVDLGNLTIGTPRQPSWERRRPGLNPADVMPAPVTRPGQRRPGRQTPLSPGLDYFRYGPAPDVPNSPSTTTATSSTQSSTAPSTKADHWLPDVFGQSRPTTVFETTGSESACHGENQPSSSASLRNEHDVLLTLPFESGFLETRFYIRHDDRRARIWCRMDRNGHRRQCYQSITSLRILRKDSCLQLCKTDSRRRAHLWANLRFASYERLVLYYCSFLALKAQDEGQPVKELDDHILDGEIIVFSGKIIDDNFQHALQIFKDRNSGGIRLQASVLRGPLKRSPVWTAFINYKIQALRWIRLAEPRKVHLLDLTRYVFSHDYLPHMGPNGEHELYFLDSAAASKFMDAIEDLAEGRI